jgi:hypothetical protein
MGIRVDIGGLSPDMNDKWPGMPLEGRGIVTEARRVRGITLDIGGLMLIWGD